jgi:hypothetical protein
LEMMQRLAAGARAKVAEDRRRLEELQAQRADARGGVSWTDGPVTFTKSQLSIKT